MLWFHYWNCYTGSKFTFLTMSVLILLPFAIQENIFVCKRTEYSYWNQSNAQDSAINLNSNVWIKRQDQDKIICLFVIEIFLTMLCRYIAVSLVAKCSFYRIFATLYNISSLTKNPSLLKLVAFIYYYLCPWNSFCPLANIPAVNH